MLDAVLRTPRRAGTSTATAAAATRGGEGGRIRWFLRYANDDGDGNRPTTAGISPGCLPHLPPLLRGLLVRDGRAPALDLIPVPWTAAPRRPVPLRPRGGADRGYRGGGGRGHGYDDDDDTGHSVAVAVWVRIRPGAARKLGR